MKKKRSRKQIAAAKRNLRKARHARRGSAREPGVREKVRRGSRKAKARGRKAAATRKRNKAKRRTAARKGARKARKSPARKSSKRSGHRKSPKRVAAGRKAARTRAHRRSNARSHAEYEKVYKGGDPDMYSERGRRRKKSKRRAKRKNPLPLAAAPRRRRKRKHNPIAAAPRKRRKSARSHGTRKYKRGKKAGYSTRGKGRRFTKRRRANAARRGWDRKRGRKIRRNPITRRSNPITGPGEFFSGVLGVGAGFAFGSFLDRLACTHPYTTGSGGLLDSPAAGAIYNSEAIAAPIWQSQPGSSIPWRLVAGGASIVIPLAAASWSSSHPNLKAFFQLMGFAAVGKLSGKLIEDGAASLLSTNALVQKLYAPELAARAKLTAGATTALPAAPAATFAGLPRGFSRGVGGVIQDSVGNPYVQVDNTLYPAPPPPPVLKAAPVIITPAAPPAVNERPIAPAVQRQAAPDAPYNPFASNPDGHA